MPADQRFPVTLGAQPLLLALLAQIIILHKRIFALISKYKYRYSPTLPDLYGTKINKY